MTATNAPSSQSELSAEQKAHEPSMDDILASIRRLISDDDALPLSRRARAAVESRVASSSGAAEARPEPGDPAAKIALHAEPGAPPKDAFFGLVHRLGRHPSAAPEATVSAPDVLKPEPRAAEPKREPSISPPPASVIAKTPALKLRDFALKNFVARPDPAARTEAAPQLERAEPAGLAAPETPPAPLAAENLRPSLPTTDEPAPAVQPGAGQDSRQDVQQDVQQESPAPQAVPPISSVVSLPTRPAPIEARQKIAPLPLRAPLFAAPAAKTVVETAQQPPQLPPQAPPQEPALLSPASDARIGASFEALAESLLASDKDLLERMAREMLRPMLKDWLEDNLPGLVERLVRAEIERIARGRG